MFRHSQFNHLAQVPGEEAWVLVNFNHGTFAKLDPIQKALFDIAPSLRTDLPLVRNWQHEGFLVDEDFDEIAQMREQAWRFHDGFLNGTQKRSLEIVVTVTSACNFACPYCFQDRRDGHMAPEVRDALVRFVERRLASGRHNHLGVAWFGGEPLLAPEIIDELSAQFMSLADRYGVGYRAMIHTNGFLLDQDMVDFLEARAVKAAIVPLDGMAEAHNATRYLHGGAPTFERIMGNLRSIKTSMFVNIRNNLHAGSLDSFDELCETIDAIARENGTNIRCSPSMVQQNAASRARGCSTEMITEDQYEQALAHTDLPAKLDAFSPIFAPCMAALANEVHIDDLGYIYPHCSTYAVDPSRAVGNLLDEDEGGPDAWIPRLDDAMRAYRFPDDQPKCLACKFLPCCLGGCPMKRTLTGEVECPSALFDPDSFALSRLVTQGRSYRHLSVTVGPSPMSPVIA